MEPDPDNPWYHPDLAPLLVDDLPGLRASWATVRDSWEATIEGARSLPENKLHERVAGEWSFVETLRHLVFATDIWVSRMVHGDPDPCHPMGLSYDGWTEGASVGLDDSLTPTLAEVLAVYRGRMDVVTTTLEGLTAEDLQKTCVPPGPGVPDEPEPLLVCMWTPIEEGWWHRRYAERDLAVLRSSESA